MRVLSCKQIERAAKTSRKAAIICCRRHWQELRAAKLEKLKKEIGSMEIADYTCALCLRYKDCEECYLWYNECCDDSPVFEAVCQIYSEYIRTGKGRRKWQKAANRIIDRLEKMLTKEQ